MVIFLNIHGKQNVNLSSKGCERTWKVSGRHPVLVAEQDEVELLECIQSHLPSIQREFGSDSVHCSFDEQ